jgi:hypothetical protein
MGEPEDLIIDGAFIASRLARQARRRYSPPPAASDLPLADVRLELILNGLFEAPIAAAAAPPPASVSWLARSPDTPPIHQRTSRRGRTAFVFSSPRSWTLRRASNVRAVVTFCSRSLRLHVSTGAARPSPSRSATPRSGIDF